MLFKNSHYFQFFVLSVVFFTSTSVFSVETEVAFNYKSISDAKISLSNNGETFKKTAQKYCEDKTKADVLLLDKDSKDINANYFEIASTEANITKLSFSASFGSSSNGKKYVVMYWTGDVPAAVDDVSALTYQTVTVNGYKQSCDAQPEEVSFSTPAKVVRIYTKVEIKDSKNKKLKEGDGQKINFKEIKVTYASSETPPPPASETPTLEVPDATELLNLKEDQRTDTRLSKSMKIKGSHLKDNVNVKAPDGIEISEDNGVTWKKALVIAPAADGSMDKTVLVRSKYGTVLEKGKNHIIDGNIGISSTDAASLTLKLGGTVENSASGGTDTEAPVIGILAAQLLSVTSTNCGTYYPIADYTTDASLIALVRSKSSDNETAAADLTIILSNQSVAASETYLYTQRTNMLTLLATVTDAAGNSSTRTIELDFKWVIPTALSITRIPNFCVNSSPYTLTLLTGTETATGVYSGTGVAGKVFTPSSVAAGSYMVTYSDPSTGCSTTSNKFTVYDLSTISVTPTTADACANAELTFETETSSITPSKDKYAWTVNGTVDATQTSKSYVMNIATAGTYKIGVSITDGRGCTSSVAMATATVEAKPNAPTVASSALCQSNGILSWNSLVSKYTGTLLWYDSETSTSAISLSDISLSASSTTTMWVSCKSSAGCESDRSSVTATVYSSPTISKITVTPDEHDVMVAIAGGTAPYSYSCGTLGGISPATSIGLGIMQFGNYTVEVSDSHNCTVKSSFTVSEVSLVPSKFFTPNGDGINDTWKIDGIASYPETRIYIFDRFGRQMIDFKGEDYTGWDGKVGGNDVSTGTYWYVIEIRETGGRKTGALLLKR